MRGPSVLTSFECLWTPKRSTVLTAVWKFVLQKGFCFLNRIRSSLVLSRLFLFNLHNNTRPKWQKQLGIHNHCKQIKITYFYVYAGSFKKEQKLLTIYLCAKEKKVKPRDVTMVNSCGCQEIYIRTARPQLLYNFGTFESFLAGFRSN